MNQTPDIPAEWLADFEAASRRSLEQRFKYSVVKTSKPILEDSEYRSWDTMVEDRVWCRGNLPDWFGYGRRDGDSSNNTE